MIPHCYGANNGNTCATFAPAWPSICCSYTSFSVASESIKETKVES